jgi:hypothetical protein
MATPNSTGSTVVARFVDGRVIKGVTHDFSPQESFFHIAIWDDPAAKALKVPVRALKALFFVRTYKGNSQHDESRDIDNANVVGRKLVVTFADGEVLCGSTTGDSSDKPGFFVIPIDPESNNSLVFVVGSSIKQVEWAKSPAPVPAGA